MTNDGRTAPRARNRLLATLPQPDYERLVSRLEDLAIDAPTVLYEPGAPLTHVYFPEDCVFSLLTVLADGRAVEVATIGNEGLLGLPLLFGLDAANGRVLCQIAGRMRRITAAAFREELAAGAALTGLVHRYAGVLFDQVIQSVACNGAHSVSQRCARWL